MNQTKRAPAKEIFGWAMFDFANSSYTTVIITVSFGVIFSKLIVGNPLGTDPLYKKGNLLWSVALSISYLLVVISAPVFGAIMDFSASKKKFLFYSYLLTVFATGALFFATPGAIFLSMLLLIVSNFGFASGESFVSAFLPGLGPSEDLGKISGYAWGLGYFGGLISTAIVQLGLGAATLENFSNLRLIGPFTGAFFMIAAIPTFLWLKERAVPKPLPGGSTYLGMSVKRLKKTLEELKDHRDLMFFLIAFFFAYAGLSIVISFAFIYGDQVVKWSPMSQTLMFIITQFTAALGAVLFGFIQDRFGAIRSFNITMILWVLAIMLIYFTNDLTRWLNHAFGMSLKAENLFLVIGCLAGLGLGSTQSSSRALVGIFSPKSKSGEFFGFWGLSGKLSAIFGLLGLGLLQSWLGLHKAIFFTAILFVISFVFTFMVDEKRGKENARAHEGD